MVASSGLGPEQVGPGAASTTGPRSTAGRPMARIASADGGSETGTGAHRPVPGFVSPLLLLVAALSILEGYIWLNVISADRWRPSAVGLRPRHLRGRRRPRASAAAADGGWWSPPVGGDLRGRAGDDRAGRVHQAARRSPAWPVRPISCSRSPPWRAVAAIEQRSARPIRRRDTSA